MEEIIDVFLEIIFDGIKFYTLKLYYTIRKFITGRPVPKQYLSKLELLKRKYILKEVYVIKTLDDTLYKGAKGRVVEIIDKHYLLVNFMDLNTILKINKRHFRLIRQKTEGK